MANVRALLSLTQRVGHFSQTRSMCAAKVEKCVNSVTLLGRTGAAPQMRGSESHPVVNFSLATHTHQKLDSGDITQKTEWHRVAVFKPYLRDTVYKYLDKGQRVLVQGRLAYGEITDAQGVQRTTTTIIADDVIFLTKSDAVDRRPAEGKVGNLMEA